eukprot:2359907-Pyramimonas_sp.AAC.1
MAARTPTSVTAKAKVAAKVSDDVFRKVLEKVKAQVKDEALEETIAREVQVNSSMTDAVCVRQQVA